MSLADQVVGAKGLSTQGKSKKLPNPYVTVQIGDFTKRTKLVKQTTNPSWNDVFEL
jgi:Ca2+-dependent lipid-binding protein